MAYKAQYAKTNNIDPANINIRQVGCYAPDGQLMALQVPSGLRRSLLAAAEGDASDSSGSDSWTWADSAVELEAAADAVTVVGDGGRRSAARDLTQIDPSKVKILNEIMNNDADVMRNDAASPEQLAGPMQAALQTVAKGAAVTSVSTKAAPAPPAPPPAAPCKDPFEYPGENTCPSVTALDSIMATPKCYKEFAGA